MLGNEPTQGTCIEHRQKRKPRRTSWLPPCSRSPQSAAKRHIRLALPPKGSECFRNQYRSQYICCLFASCTLLHPVSCGVPRPTCKVGCDTTTKTLLAWTPMTLCSARGACSSSEPNTGTHITQTLALAYLRVDPSRLQAAAMSLQLARLAPPASGR